MSKVASTVFESEGCEIVLTPLQAPNANSHPERWIRTARNECLDHILIFNQTHLVSVLREFEAYYNERRPHQGIGRRMPVMPDSESLNKGPIRRRNVIGGVIHDYYRLAAWASFSLGISFRTIRATERMQRSDPTMPRPFQEIESRKCPQHWPGSSLVLRKTCGQCWGCEFSERPKTAVLYQTGSMPPMKKPRIAGTRLLNGHTGTMVVPALTV